MTLKQRLFTNMFLRNLMADFGIRPEYSISRNKLIPYFQYKIGGYQSDHYLYFPKEPYALKHKNKIFNKLKEYSGYNITQYLEFHYLSYPDKNNFLRFLLYETPLRLKSKISNVQKIKLQTVFDWVNEKQQEQLTLHKQELTKQIEKDVRTALDNEPHSKQLNIL